MYQDGVCFHLPGLHQLNQIEDHTSRSVHFAGGRVEASVPFSKSFTVQFWVWSGIINKNEPINNHIAELNGLNLNLINKQKSLQFKFLNTLRRVDIDGIEPRSWNLVTLVANPNSYEIWVNDVHHFDFKHDIITSDNVKVLRLVFGGDIEGKADFHGKIDEIAFFDRALTSKEIINLYKSSNP